MEKISLLHGSNVGMPIDTPLWPDVVDGLLVRHLATPVGPGGPTWEKGGVYIALSKGEKKK